MIKLPQPKGGSGFCSHCQKWHNNVSFHEANCGNSPSNPIEIKGPVYTVYPDPDIPDMDMDNVLYYVEFIQWETQPLMWKLYKRNFIPSKSFLGKEGHPYVISEGTIHPNQNMITMDNVEFLKFMVDALNEKVARKMTT